MHLPSKKPETVDRVSILKIPLGEGGTLATLKAMRVWVKQAKKHYPIRKLALSIVRNNKNKDYIQEVKSIQAWVKKNIRYVKDIRGIETLQSAIKTLELRQGDCDDHAVIVASLLETIGHETRLKAVGFTKNSFSHVFTETRLGKRSKNMWLSVETTEKNWPVGKQPRGIKNLLVVRI